MKRRMRRILHEVKMGLTMFLWPTLWVSVFLIMVNKVGTHGLILAFILFLWDTGMLIRNMGGGVKNGRR